MVALLSMGRYGRLPSGITHGQVRLMRLLVTHLIRHLIILHSMVLPTQVHRISRLLGLLEQLRSAEEGHLEELLQDLQYLIGRPLGVGFRPSRVARQSLVAL